VLDEPIRGGFPDPSFHGLPGIDRARAWMRGLVPSSPITRLLGGRLTQVGVGSAAVSLRASPWLQHANTSLDVPMSVELALWTAALAGAPAGHEVRTAALSLNYFRRCTVESEALVLRAKTIHTGRAFTVGEVQVEDALGRTVVTATGSVVVRPLNPAPPPLLRPLQPVVSPSYPTPDPPARPLPPGAFPFRIWEELDGLSVLRRVAAGDLPNAPLYDLLGLRFVDVASGAVTMTLRTSEWHCVDPGEVTPGVVACLAGTGLGSASMTVLAPGRQLGVIAVGMSFLRPVPPDGRELVARGTLLHDEGGLFVSAVEVTDDDGNRVALGQMTSLLLPERQRRAEAERRLATVLFTDIVGSTQRAAELGDARWRELLDEHHAFVRMQLDVFKGREVKTTGDGFLATFDAPGRAVQCARAIRDGVRRFGLEVRAGLHTGECEVSGGDVAGIAVHAAARIQGVAGPGEILVSATVHDLVAGSGLRFADRGRHPLKGIEGDWPLFAVDG